MELARCNRACGVNSSLPHRPWWGSRTRLKNIGPFPHFLWGASGPLWARGECVVAVPRKLEPDWRGKIITSLRHKRHRQVQARRWRCGIALSATATAYDSAQRIEVQWSHHTLPSYRTDLGFSSYPWEKRAMSRVKRNLHRKGHGTAFQCSKCLSSSDKNCRQILCLFTSRNASDASVPGSLSMDVAWRQFQIQWVSIPNQFIPVEFISKVHHWNQFIRFTTLDFEGLREI